MRCPPAWDTPHQTPGGDGAATVAPLPLSLFDGGAMHADVEHELPEPDEASEPVTTESLVDEAEAEESEEAAHEAAGEPAEAPEAQGPTQQDWEKRWDKVEKRFATYTRAASEIWEDDALDLVPFMFSPSAPPGFLAKADAGRLPDENKRALLEWLGYAQEQEYKPDPELHLCETCDGRGFTARPSKVAGKSKRTCPTCGGEGDDIRRSAQPAQQTNGHVEEPFSLAEGVPAESADADNWGQPRILPDGRENPNWGRQPSYWVRVEPWGDTRNLTPQDVSSGV